jgi:hypothetical protein
MYGIMNTVATNSGTAARSATGYIVRVPVGVVGIAAVSTAVFGDALLGGAPGFGVLQMVLAVAGCVLLVIAVAPGTTNLCLATLAVLCTVTVIEASFRLVGYDLERTLRDNIPIFYRQPTEPVGDVFFRRPGPAVWKGKVLSVQRDVWRALDDVYADETPVTVTYDKDGFRNPAALRDWDMVVIGDSFVELGYLPQEDLYTTILSGLVHQGVKNLGVSYVGPLTYLFYFEHYGLSPSTRRALFVFFEGNDLDDLQREQQALEVFKTTGEREYRPTPVSHPSFLIPAYRVIESRVRYPRRLLRNAYFASQRGDVAVSLLYTPPGSQQLTAEQMALLQSTLQSMAESGRRHGVEPWLVYMPCKLRVLEGHLRFTEDADRRLVDWRPSDLPLLLARMAGLSGMGFIDVTPALVAEAARGVLTYNSIGDTHLNRQGAAVVAHAIAAGLQPQH